MAQRQRNSFMKKHIFILLYTLVWCVPSFFSQTSHTDPVLMEIDNKKITKSDFLQVYLKNNSNPKYDQQTLDEYIELYKKFQLKVAEAEALGYDTIKRLTQELEGYQRQLTLPYLTDKETNQQLVKEAYERMKKEVRASHILIKVDAGNDDTLAAYNRAMEVREKLLNNARFDSLALVYSQDESVANNQGDLGYFTAFQMVYPFEQAAYTLQVGEVSMPIRTRFGYHILKLTDVRNARGTMTAAHIMITARKNTSSQQDIERAQAKINELYAKLQAGENFEELAVQYSEDPGSADKGGLLPVFGTGTTTRLLPIFEQTAFSLEQNGDYSRPIQSEMGFHIIKRLSWSPLKPFEELKKEIEQKVSRDERAQITQASFIEKLKKEYNFELENQQSIEWLSKNLDSSIYQGNFDLSQFNIVLEPIFTLNQKTYTQADFVNYLNGKARQLRGIALSEIPQKMKQSWIDDEVIELEKQQLPNKYPEYKALMQEYHNGILLYEIMNDKVWNKAIKDTEGLQAFYKKNKAKYQWDKRYDLIAYIAANQQESEKVYQLAKNKISPDTILKQMTLNSSLNLSLQVGVFEQSKLAYIHGQKLKKGLNKPYEFQGKYYVVKINKIIKAQPKALNEAKGLIASDYQAELEQKWLEELAKKHTVIIHHDVLYSLGK